MKRLLAVAVVVCVAVLMLAFLSPQIGAEETARPRVELSGGFFYPTDDSFRETYSAGLTLNCGLVGAIGRQEFRLCVGYFRKKFVTEGIFERENTFHLFPITLAWIFRFYEQEDGVFYAGVGPGFYFCEQKMETSSAWGSSSVSIDGSGVGWFGLVGFESNNSPCFIFELKWRIARPKIEVFEIEGELNLDGPIVSFGIRL